MHPDPCQRLTEKAIICVSSKLEIVTIPRLAKGKDKAAQNGKKQSPKVPGAMKGAPGNLFFLPWFKQLPWLEPAAAQALRNKVDAEVFGFERRKKIPREAQRERRG